jgi:hypothetical protein
MRTLFGGYREWLPRLLFVWRLREPFAKRTVYFEHPRWSKRLDGSPQDRSKCGPTKLGGVGGTDRAMPLRLASSNCHGGTRSGVSVPLQGVPAPHRYRFPFRRKFSERAGAARWGAEGLRARRRQRLSDSVSFLPELRHHPVLGGRPQSCGLRSGRGRFRYLGFPAAQRLDLGGVDASVAWPAAAFGAPPAGSTSDHNSNVTSCWRGGASIVNLVSDTRPLLQFASPPQ